MYEHANIRICAYTHTRAGPDLGLPKTTSKLGRKLGAKVGGKNPQRTPDIKGELKQLFAKETIWVT